MSFLNAQNPRKNAGGTVNWDDINGRPDLSKLTNMSVAQIVLQSGLWDQQNEQTVSVPGVLEDEVPQFIVTSAKRSDKAAYRRYGVELIDQGNDTLIFHAESVPEEDLHVIVRIFEAAEIDEIDEEYAGEFAWWSPQMTSNDTPSPYRCSASSVMSSFDVFHAFDNNSSTFWHASTPNESWIQFDFGGKTPVKCVRLSPRYGYYEQLPKEGVIKGSYDEVKWYDILRFENGIAYSDPYLELTFDKAFNYRYYKIDEMDSKQAYLSIRDIEFYKLEDE